MSSTQPTQSFEVIIDNFISTATRHLATISGIANTISLYPTGPAVGVVPWTGYIVPPTSSNSAITQNSRYVETKEREIDNIIDNFRIGDNRSEYTWAMYNENISKSSYEIQSGRILSQYVNEPPRIDADVPFYDIISFARRYVGMIETGTGAGTPFNYGGSIDGTELNIGASGVIDSMLSISGLDNQSRVTSSGMGFPWAPSAIAFWLSQTGYMIPLQSGRIRSWVGWAIENSYTSTTPSVGSIAMFSRFGRVGQEIHMGLVESILPDGTLITIEGDTSGLSYLFDCGCFRKRVTDVSNISMYINPVRT